MTWFQSSRRRTRRGAAAAEFAITLPVMVLMLFGTIEFGNYFAEANAIQGVAREACRYGANQWDTPRAANAAAAAFREIMNDRGTPCTDDCIVNTLFTNSGSVAMLQLQVSVPYEQVTGAIPNSAGGVLVAPNKITTVVSYPLSP